MCVTNSSRTAQLEEMNHFVDIEMLSAGERMERVAEILTKGILRVIEKRQQEAAKDRAFGESLMAEVAALPGGQA